MTNVTKRFIEHIERTFEDMKNQNHSEKNK